MSNHMDYDDYNHNQAERDAWLGLQDETWRPGSIKYFGDLPASRMELLITEKFLDPEDAQNDAPSAGEFLEFMQKHPGSMAHGYAVNLDRTDYRISIEGISVASKYVTHQCVVDFVEMCRHADSFTIDEQLYCWFD